MKGRKIWQWAVLTGVLLALQPAASQGQSTTDLMRKLEQLRAYPELIVINAKISTMNAQMSEFQAMAVKNNRILALGTNDEIRFLAGPKTEIVDAKGRRVLPGLIEAHTHPHFWGIFHWMEKEGDFAAKKYNDPQLRIVSVTGKDPTEIVRNVERTAVQRANEMGPGKWIIVHMYAGNNLAESGHITTILVARPPTYRVRNPVPIPAAPITRAFLDAIAPVNPVMVSSAGLGPSVHNSKAKEEMLKFLVQEVDGLGSWVPLFHDLLMRGRTEEKVDFLKRELMTCLAAQGLTTFANHYYGTPSIMEIYRLLNERGEMPVRYAWWVGGSRAFVRGDYKDNLGYPSLDREVTAENNLALAVPDLGDFRGIGNDYIWNAGIAFEIYDMNMGCTTAKKLNPNQPLASNQNRDCADAPKDYDGDPDFAMYRSTRAAFESGLRIGYLHLMSDGSWDMLFDMIEEAIAKGKLTLEQVKAMRITGEHIPRIRPDQIPKIVQYGIRASLTGRPSAGAEFLQLHGEQYLDWILPMKSVVDAGARPMFNTDAHVHDEPFQFQPIDKVAQGKNIWGFLEFYLTRSTGDPRLPPTPRQAVDRVNLMKSATIWNAEGLLNEKNIGSLEVGKLADFIVLDKDYFAVPEDQVHTINTLLTAVGGKIEFKSPHY